eukprot:TRINITY_DN6723_c0_g1_i3.p1 TRINITY_DN6723_c0_g1~~TRINITY_DN6723_c0_g1_i3.p1  ORF type:complete len:412 (-),score=67.19 TRINITY_DN6723_c0_g1_i3:57-1292(-)
MQTSFRTGSASSPLMGQPNFATPTSRSDSPSRSISPIRHVRLESPGIPAPAHSPLSGRRVSPPRAAYTGSTSRTPVSARRRPISADVLSESPSRSFDLQRKLATLENRMLAADSARKLRAEDSQVKKVSDRVALLEKQIDQQRTQTVEDTGKIRQEMNTYIVQNQTLQRKLAALEAENTQLLQERTIRQGRPPDLSADVARLTRNVHELRLQLDQTQNDHATDAATRQNQYHAQLALLTERMQGLSGHITSLEQDLLTATRHGTQSLSAPEPKIPRVGVAVIVVRGDLILVGKRRQTHGAGQLAPPGGHLEFGESFSDCARRELREETSLECDDPQLIQVSNDIVDGGDKHYVTIIMRVLCHRGEPINNEPQKCSGWQWMKWDQIQRTPPSQLFLSLSRLVATGKSPCEEV